MRRKIGGNHRKQEKIKLYENCSQVQSRGGNTRGMAEIIARMAGITEEPVYMPLIEKVDLLFLGGAVYMWRTSP